MVVYPGKELDFIEHFAGAGVLAREARNAGYNVAGVDILYSRGMDVLKPSGFGSLPCIQHFLQDQAAWWLGHILAVLSY